MKSSMLTFLALFVSLAHGEEPAPAPFGAPDAEERLRSVLDEAFKTPPPDTPGDPDLPADFPQFERDGFMGGNMSGLESQVVQLWLSNAGLLASVKRFSKSSVRAEFARRMELELAEPALRLIYAQIAAETGSRDAAFEILNSMKSTSYDAVMNTHSVLAGMLSSHRDDPPGWMVELAMAAVVDDRRVTDLDRTNWATGTEFRMSYLSAEYGRVVYALGEAKCTQAVPLLIDRVRTSQASREYVMALGDIGDKRAVPVLLEHLVPLIRNLEDPFDRRDRLIWALARMRAPEVVPLLIDHLEFPKAIEALETIGDARAAPPLKALIEGKGIVRRNGTPIATYDESERLGRAKIALAWLEDGDRVPRLATLLEDPTLDKYQYCDVLRRLGDTADARAVPPLLHAIRTGKDGFKVFTAISALSAIPCTEAVEGLMECLGMTFEDLESDSKLAFDSEALVRRALEGLRKLTDLDLPADTEKWKSWWSANKADFRFKDKSR